MSARAKVNQRCWEDRDIGKNESEMTGKVKINDGKLVFELRGTDEIFSIRRSISVPLDKIISVTTERVPPRLFEHIRVAGAQFPGKIKDCRYVTSDGLVFFEMHNPKECVTIALDHKRYKKIILEVEDKENIWRQISEAIKSKQKM